MNRPRNLQETEILKEFGLGFHKDSSGFWKIAKPTITPSKLKSWVVDRLMDARFDSDFGISYFIARNIRKAWKGFDRA